MVRLPAIEASDKECKECEIVKPVDEFYIQQQKCTKNADTVWKYYDPVCKMCRSKYGVERRRLIKVQAIMYKGAACLDCGYDDLTTPEVFDFHHIDPSKKDFSFGSKAGNAFETHKPELDKCVLLCANCHRIRHARGG